MLIRVLGSAAGGGFPQWNCNCNNCRGLRAGTLRASGRSQSSIAVSADGERWLLCNVSPDIHRQIAANFPPRAADGLRQTAIAAAILVDGQLDHAAGLLLLRENRAPLEVWSTDPVREDLTQGFPVLGVLERYCGIDWHRVPTAGQPFAIRALPGIAVEALAVPGRPAPYSLHRLHPRSGDNVALIFRECASGRQVVYAPGLQSVTPPLEQALRASSCVLVDGTFWTDDELIRLGASPQTATAMGHLPQTGPSGMIAELERLPRTTRRILIHINNTNPILDEAGPERALLTTAGIEVAFDGMEIGP